MKPVERRPCGAVARREALRQEIAAARRGADQRLGGLSAFHLGEQPIDQDLPLLLRNRFGCGVIGDDAGEPLGERNIQQHAIALMIMGEAAQGELLERGAMRIGPPDPRRRQQEAQARQRQDEERDDEDRKLHKVNALGRNLGEIEQRPGRKQGEYGAPDERHDLVIRRGASKDENDLAARPRLRGADRGLDAGGVVMADRHHQLPEAPPPPDEPPPPEKLSPPPPKKPPPPKSPRRELPPLSSM